MENFRGLKLTSKRNFELLKIFVVSKQFRELIKLTLKKFRKIKIYYH